MTGVARALPRTTSAPDGTAPEERRDEGRLDGAPAVVRAVPSAPVPHPRPTPPGAPAPAPPAAAPVAPQAAAPVAPPEPAPTREAPDEPCARAPDVPASDPAAPDLTAPDVPASDLAAPDPAAPDRTAPDRSALDLAAAPDSPASGDAAPARRGRTANGPGRRELRRQETRARIVDAAADLFAERGFDSVSVVEIARRAGVVEKTVFNHFPVKEGLVFDADPPVRTALLGAVRRRPVGESVSAAAGTFVVTAMSRLGEPEVASGLARMARIVRGSRTLQVREQEILGELTTALAALIAEETDARSGQLEPWLTAHAVLGLYAGLLELARDRALAGITGAPLAAELRRRGQRGLALLQFGLAGYGKRR
ncbi:TetR family transcriptional regulator [Geodermatophilus sp. YIM 151500]|uniref:TetR/AcrR family transcriptional regulator n=1 Tax=Geodermatophilus sp. YIM 151500 TaxID=2984531 RepID=UPI0021E39619|nr:TetR family transcriptional regulator [Geodermatophilus sp. YIM 151500]MCV2489008.1 TetR family transcriptional regulator [Geodermatophilus sp. YIM 151500]